MKGGGRGGFPPLSAGEAGASLRERHIPRLLWKAYPKVRKSESLRVRKSENVPKSHNRPNLTPTKKMRTATCCMEQGIHDHFGCDLSDLESISDPGCPEKTKKSTYNVSL